MWKDVSLAPIGNSDWVYCEHQSFEYVDNEDGSCSLLLMLYCGKLAANECSNKKKDPDKRGGNNGWHGEGWHGDIKKLSLL